MRLAGVRINNWRSIKEVSFGAGRVTALVDAIARQDGRPLAFAGIWESFCWPDETVHRSFAIMTTRPNAEIDELQDRMPVILEEQDWPVWLAESDGDHGALLRPSPDGTLRTWPVDRRVGSPRNNGPELLEATKLHVRWQGGATETLELQLPPNRAEAVRYPEAFVMRIRELAISNHDDDIIRLLHAEGHQSSTGKPLTVSMIYKHRIPAPKMPDNTLNVREVRDRYQTHHTQ
jgi:hypothetical protein